MTTLLLPSSLQSVHSTAAASVQLFVLCFAALQWEQTHPWVLLLSVFMCLGRERIKCALKIFLSAK